MRKFQKIKENIIRATYIHGNTQVIDNSSPYIDSKYMVGEEMPLCQIPMNVIDVWLTPREIYRNVPDGVPQVEIIKTVDGQRTYIKNLKQELKRISYRARLTIRFSDDECIYGLGQDEDGVYNKRGHIEYLYQNNMRTPMPMFVSSCGYGVLFNCGCLMVFDDTAENTTITMECVDQVDFFVIIGNMDEVVAGYRELTGRAAPMPEWMLGYIQSKERYATQQELLEVAEKYRKLEIPLDVVIQDWKTWVGDLWGDKRLDKDRYPNIKETIQKLHELHVRTLVSVWPNMNAGGSDHSEFAEKGMLLNDYSTYNAFDEKARQVYWKQAEHELYNGGFDGWWCDSTEPFPTPDWCGEIKRSEEVRYQIVGDEHEKYLDPATANLYALMHAKGMYENQPEKPVVNLTRSGYAGIQKYGAVLWAGDTSASWENLRRDITKGLSISMCGIPYWTVDAGAFFAGGVACWRRSKGDANAAPVWFWNGEYDEGVKDKGYQELYVRWLQFSCFLPIFRSHGTDTPREVWHFEKPFYDAIVKTIKLRYQLIPYILDMAKRVTDEHYTILRSLLFDFPDDENVRNIDNSFMFGDDILVCPVTKPFLYTAGSKELTGSSHIWECYLPKGADWYDFWSRTFYSGGQTVKMPVCLEHIPLFIRAGATIATQNDIYYTEMSKTAPVKHEKFPAK